MEELVRRIDVTKFFKSSRDGNKAYIVQERSNRSGWFLAVAEFGSGGQRGLIVRWCLSLVSLSSKGAEFCPHASPLVVRSQPLWVALP